MKIYRHFYCSNIRLDLELQTPLNSSDLQRSHTIFVLTKQDGEIWLPHPRRDALAANRKRPTAITQRRPVMTPGLLSQQIGLSPENFKEFSGGGGYSYNRFNHNDVRPFILSSNARLLLSFRCQAKVFGCFALLASMYQVIPGNLQKYVSTNRSPLQCKTLPAHFSNNMMVYCLLNVI